MIELELGDVVLINMETFRLVEGNPPSSARYLFASVKQCETFGCTNPALDHTTQIAPATNVRVCAACVEAL